MENLKNLIVTMAKALVSNPDAVEINELTGEQVTVLELKVAKEDIGNVIGRGGRIAMAMRTILAAANAKAHKGGKNCLLEIIDR